MKFKQTLNRLKASDQGGFTLIELLVVIGILAILLAVTLIAINPNKHFQDSRNAQRQSNVAAILDAIYEYESSNNGKEPPSVAAVTTAVPLSLGGGGVDVCGDLTPTFLANLPADPSTGTVTGGSTPCAVGVTAYNTGYTISQANGRFTITAPGAEDGASISVTR